MPVLTFLMLTFAFAQWIDFLKTTDFLNKYLSLLARALYDMGSFLVIFALFQLYFCLAFFAVGATFDDGGNFSTTGDGDQYDTLHNDFPMIDQFFVYIF